MTEMSMGRGTTRPELKHLCALFMADNHGDQSVLAKNGEGSPDEVIRDWLDAQARAHGFDSWVDAYYVIGAGEWEQGRPDRNRNMSYNEESEKRTSR